MLGGVALSTTSMAVVYAVMLETGFNRTDFGKGFLGACFINDLGTVISKIFGLSSGAALATVVGVLIAVPVMLMQVKICLKTTHWFKAAETGAAARHPTTG